MSGASTTNPAVISKNLGEENSQPANLNKRVKFPIRIKITLPFLIVAVFLAIGSSYVITKLVFDTVEERFTNQLVESGKLATISMVKKEDRLLETIRLLSNTEGVAEALEARDAEKLRTMVFGAVVNNREEAVEFLDVQGNLVFSMRHIIGGRIEEYTYGKQGDAFFAQWNFVKAVLQEEVDKQGDKYAGLVHTDWGNYFYISGPVYKDDGQLAGVVLVGRTLDGLADDLREDVLAQVTLYDFKGKVIASTFPEQGPTLEGDVLGILEAPTQESLRRQFEVVNMPYAEILSTWKARDSDIGLIGVSLMENYIVHSSQTTRLQVTLLVGLALFLVVLSGVYVANRITRPLLTLVHASEEVSRGNLKVQVPLNSNDEVSVLADSFNRMITNLDISRQEMMDAYDTTLEGWSKALELRDRDTEGHTRRVVENTLQIAKDIGIHDELELNNLRRGALLHDIGKMAIPDTVLHNPGRLSEDERIIMEKHPDLAREMLMQIAYLHSAIDIPYCHHEHWDGSGYPQGLKGEDIPLAARIFALADVWDALTSDRPYRPAMTHQEAVQIIAKESGSHFDPTLVDVFLKLIDQKEASVRGSS